MISNFKLFEFLTHFKETEYKLIKTKSAYDENLNCYIYIFYTNSGTKYKLEFNAYEEYYTKFNDNTLLTDYAKIINKDYNTCLCYSISYTLYERDHDNYNEVTNKNEQFELLSRVMFLINEFIKNYPKNNILVMGAIDDKKEKFYSNYFKLLNHKKIYKHHSEYMEQDIYYFIF